MMSMNLAWTAPSAIPPASHTVFMQQSAAYHRTCAALGQKTLCLTLGDVSAPQGQAHILFRQVPVIGTIAAITGGPIWAEDLSSPHKQCALNALIRQLKPKARAVLITAPSNSDPIAETAIPIMTGATSAVWTLNGDLRRNLHQKWRNRLKKAESSGLTILTQPIPRDPTHWLYQANATQGQTKSFRPYPVSFYSAWAQSNGATSGVLYTAHLKAEPIAAALILHHRSSASYQIGWSNDLGRQLSAQNLLLFQAATQFQAQGIRTLDLGLIDTVRAPDLARFKLGTGAQAHRHGPTTLTAPFTAFFAKKQKGRHSIAPAPSSW